MNLLSDFLDKIFLLIHIRDCCEVAMLYFFICKIWTTFYLLLNFLDCNCNLAGSYGNTCDANGKCSCKANIVGNKCNTCSVGFYNFPTCQGNLILILHFKQNFYIL